jgi:hypothetical protein
MVGCCCGVLTSRLATEQRWLHKRDRNVQSRVPMGYRARRAGRAQAPQDSAHCWPRGSRGQRLDIAGTRFVPLLCHNGCTEKTTNNSAVAALDLAEEYLMRPWIIALLDPSPIELGTKDKANSISSPPPFKLAEKDKMFPAPHLSRSKRELRSASPSKSSTPRKIASPRKRRAKGSKATDDESAKGTSSALQSQLENGTASLEPTPSVASEHPDKHDDDVVRVEVDETTEKTNGTETTHTTVTIEMPAGHKDLTLPDSAEGVLETSHEIVEEARKLEKAKSTKRKAGELDDDEDAEEAGPSNGSLEVQPAKKQRLLEERLKSERVKTRALVGITTTIALA